jgi:hypothetical protein
MSGVSAGHRGAGAQPACLSIRTRELSLATVDLILVRHAELCLA